MTLKQVIDALLFLNDILDFRARYSKNIKIYNIAITSSDFLAHVK